MIPTSPSIDLPNCYWKTSGFQLQFLSSLQYNYSMLEFDPTSTSPTHTNYCDYVMYSCTPNWSESYNGCNATLTANFSANRTKAITECFHLSTTQSSSLYKVWESSIRFTSLQYGVPIRGVTPIHTFVTTKTLQIRFPTLISVSLTNISAYGSALVLSSFVLQQYNPDSTGITLGNITVELYTSVQAPYQLSPSSVSVIAGQFTATLELATSSSYTCDLTTNTICEQLWTVVLFPTGSGQCVFNGTFNVSFTIGCQASYTGSCVAVTPPNYQTQITLQTSDTCAQIIEDVGVTGTLSSFKDNGYIIPSNQFIFASTAYFEVSISGPSITAVQVQRVVIIGATTIVLIRGSPKGGLQVGGSNLFYFILFLFYFCFCFCFIHQLVGLLYD